MIKEWQVGREFDISDPALLKGAHTVAQQISDEIITPHLKANIPHNHSCTPLPCTLATPLLHSKKSAAKIQNMSLISLLQCSVHETATCEKLAGILCMCENNKGYNTKQYNMTERYLALNVIKRIM
jgi:hypothetical protein